MPPSSEATAIGLDWRADLAMAARALPAHALQGNLDPCALYAHPDEVARRVRKIIEEAKLPARVTARALSVFTRLAGAEGKVHGVPPEEVLRRLRRLAEAGYREVVLTGIHLGAYGRDLREAGDLTDLLERIENGDVVDRLRLGSVEPGEIPDRVLWLRHRGRHPCRHRHRPTTRHSRSSPRARVRDARSRPSDCRAPYRNARRADRCRRRRRRNSRARRTRHLRCRSAPCPSRCVAHP